jgi:hypothetical protein
MVQPGHGKGQTSERPFIRFPSLFIPGKGVVHPAILGEDDSAIIDCFGRGDAKFSMHFLLPTNYIFIQGRSCLEIATGNEQICHALQIGNGVKMM